MPTTYISNSAHYEQVQEKTRSVRRILWIGTADIKDLYVKSGLKDSVPFLKVLADLLKRGVEVRLIHTKEPGPAFRADFDKYPILAQRLERVLCSRVHFKLMIFDLETTYISSANLTRAGMGIGMKGEHTRNFEAGIFLPNRRWSKAPSISLTRCGWGSFTGNAGGRRIVEIG